MGIDDFKIESAVQSAIKENLFDKTDLLKDCIDKQLNIYFPNNKNAQILIYTILIKAAKDWAQQIKKEQND